MLLQLAPRWPRGMPLARLFSDPDVEREDLLLLRKSGLLELRCDETNDSIDATRLRALEHPQGYHDIPSTLASPRDVESSTDVGDVRR